MKSLAMGSRPICSSSSNQGNRFGLFYVSGDGNDETTKANKRRNLMRLAFELHLVGLPVTFEKTFNQVKEIVRYFSHILFQLDLDNEDVFYANMNTAVTFIQNFNEEYIGTVSRTKKKDYTDNPKLPVAEKLVSLVAPEKKDKLFKYLKNYVDKMVAHCKKLGKVASPLIHYHLETARDRRATQTSSPQSGKNRRRNRIQILRSQKKVPNNT
jgi:hypothetical protein